MKDIFIRNFHRHLREAGKLVSKQAKKYSLTEKSVNDKALHFRHKHKVSLFATFTVTEISLRTAYSVGIDSDNIDTYNLMYMHRMNEC